MKKVRFLPSILFSFLLFIFLMAFPSKAHANLLVNPGFESWTCTESTGCNPNGWSNWGYGNHQQEQYNRHSGSYSEKHSGGGGGRYQTISVTNGAQYRISGYSYRYYDFSYEYIGVEMGNGGIAWYALGNLHGTLSWDYFQVDVTATSNTMIFYTNGNVNPFGGEGQDDTYFDDLDLVLVAPPPTSTPTPTPTTIPTPTPTPTPIPTPPPTANPNCWELRNDPTDTTITVGQPITFTARFNLESGDLRGGIAIGQTPPTLTEGLRRDSDNARYPINISGQYGTISSTWRPSAAGTYHVMCNAINYGVKECKGNNAYRAIGQIACAGPETSLTINVVNKPGAPTLQVGQGLSDDLTNQSANPVLTPVSGNQSTQSGSNYHNDIAIRVQATPADTIRQYYVAFYAKGSAAPITCTDTDVLEVCLDKFRARILNAPQNGFLLKFGRTTPTTVSGSRDYYVWKDYIGWQEIQSGREIAIPSDRAPFYKVRRDPISDFTNYKWYVTFDRSLGSKRFYTGVVAVNQYGKYSVRGEVTPTKLQP